MKTFTDLVAKNPSGLVEIVSPLSITQYNEQKGFSIPQKITIFKSEKFNPLRTEWFLFPGTTLNTLINVNQNSNTQPAYIIETLKEDTFYCHLVLVEKAYYQILADQNLHLFQVHQMYPIALERFLKTNTKGVESLPSKKPTKNYGSIVHYLKTLFKKITKLKFLKYKKS